MASNPLIMANPPDSVNKSRIMANPLIIVLVSSSLLSCSANKLRRAVLYSLRIAFPLVVGLYDSLFFWLSVVYVGLLLVRVYE